MMRALFECVLKDHKRIGIEPTLIYRDPSLYLSDNDADRVISVMCRLFLRFNKKKSSA